MHNKDKGGLKGSHCNEEVMTQSIALWHLTRADGAAGWLGPGQHQQHSGVLHEADE